MEKNIPMVKDWIPETEDDIKLKKDGKILHISFDTIFKTSEYIHVAQLNSFIIKKEVYSNNMGVIAHYVNYFIKYYDTKGSLLLGYLRMKFLIDKKNKKLSNVDTFIKFLYQTMLPDNIVQGIRDMVEYNYDIDVEQETENDYEDILKFTNEHGKILLMISMGMKILIPVIVHYQNSVDKGKDQHMIFKCFKPLFDIFGIDAEGTNIYDKLYFTILSRVKNTNKNNMGVWKKHEVYGNDIITFTDDLLKDRFISGVMFKSVFGKHIISLNSTVFERQLGFFNRERFDYNLKEASHEHDPVSNLSPADKLEMSNAKLDEGVVIMSDVNLETSMKKLMKKFNYDIPEDELKYYEMHFKGEKFQIDLKLNFFAKYFGGFRDLQCCTDKDHLKLLILMKRYLQVFGYKYLPDLLSGNLQGRLSKRTIQNSKFLNKIQTSDIFINLMKNKFGTLDELDKKKFIITPLSTLLNSTFTYVDYDNPEQLGEVIEVQTDIVCFEFLNFLNLI